MFEAHIYTEASHTETFQENRSVALNTPACCWHSLHQCNVRYWITSGKRQSRDQLFLYVEFRNRDNSHSYKLIELQKDHISKDELHSIICRSSLSAQLDPVKTEQWCQSF